MKEELLSKWEIVKQTLENVPDDFTVLLTNGDVIRLDPTEIIKLIDHTEGLYQQLTEKDATIDEQQTEMDRINNHLYKACMDVEALRKALEEIARIESHINITTIRIQEIAKSALGEGDKE